MLEMNDLFMWRAAFFFGKTYQCKKKKKKKQKNKRYFRQKC